MASQIAALLGAGLVGHNPCCSEHHSVVRSTSESEPDGEKISTNPALQGRRFATVFLRTAFGQMVS